MSHWTDPDVTPVGGRAGERAGWAHPAGRPPEDDPFGSRPSVRRPGLVRVALGVLLVVGGIAATVAGIAQAVATRAAIETDAVARGEVRAGAAAPVTFTARAGGPREYTVHLIFGGVAADEREREAAVRDTACAAALPGGGRAEFRGNRQGVASSIGQASSVGHFATPPGAVAIACGFAAGSRRSRRERPAAVAFVVAPGKPDLLGDGVVTIVGGVSGAIGGGFLAAWGWRRRRPA